MKRALLSLVVLCISLPLYAALVDQSEIVALYDRERSGMRAYQAGDYESAFEFLSVTATKGLKESQYLVALMLLKGQGVDKSTLAGLAWLGCALTEKRLSPASDATFLIRKALSHLDTVLESDLTDNEHRELLKVIREWTSRELSVQRALGGLALLP